MRGLIDLFGVVWEVVGGFVGVCVFGGDLSVFVVVGFEDGELVVLGVFDFDVELVVFVVVGCVDVLFGLCNKVGV